MNDTRQQERRDVFRSRAKALMGERTFVFEDRKVVEVLPECAGFFNTRFGSVVVFDRDTHRKLQRRFEGASVRFDDLAPMERRFGPAFYELVVFLLKEKLLRETRDVEARRYAQAMRREYAVRKQRRAVRMFYLFLTVDCNLNCQYCFVRQSSYEKKLRHRQMSPALVRRVSTFIAQKSAIDGESKSVVFFGGEPLLEMPLIEEAARWFVRHGNTARFGWHPPQLGLVTNGLLMTPRIIDVLGCYDIKVGLSLDSISDAVGMRLRPTVSGAPYARELLANMERLDQRGLLESVNVAITRKNMKQIPHMLRLIRKRCGVVNVKFNHLHLVSPKVNELIPEFEKSIPRLDEIYDAAEELGFRLIGDCYPVYCALAGVTGPNYSSCAANGDIMCVDPDGDAFPCVRMCSEASQRVPFRDGFNVLASKVFRDWSLRSPWNLPECFDRCELFSVCGGKCMANVLYRKGTIRATDAEECLLNRYFFRRALRMRIREIWEEQQGRRRR